MAAKGPQSVDPASLRIVNYPHPALRKKAEKVEGAKGDVRAVAERMVELMREAEGIGLAAPQVALPWRLFVLDVPEDAEEERLASSDPPAATKGPMVFVNPVLSGPEGEMVSYEEGCLSLPEIRGNVLRPETITVTAIDAEGKKFTLKATGLLARCIQHETDHLDGVLIIDKMSQLARLKNRTKVKDLEKAAKM